MLIVPRTNMEPVAIKDEEIQYANNYEGSTENLEGISK